MEKFHFFVLSLRNLLIQKNVAKEKTSSDIEEITEFGLSNKQIRM